MATGRAPKTTRRRGAGLTKPGPRTDSGWSHPRPRGVSGRAGPPGIGSALTAMRSLPCPLFHGRSALPAMCTLPWPLFRMRSARLRLHLTRLPSYDLLHLVLGPGDRVLGRGAGHRLGDHVRQDVRVGDQLHPIRRGSRPAVGVVLHSLTPERRVLAILPEHRVVLELIVGGPVEGVARHDVLAVDLALGERIADPTLGGVDVLGELPDPDVPRGIGLVPSSGPPQ